MSREFKLVIAARDGDEEAVKKLLDVRPMGDALEEAAINGHDRIIYILWLELNESKRNIVIARDLRSACEIFCDKNKFEKELPGKNPVKWKILIKCH